MSYTNVRGDADCQPALQPIITVLNGGAGSFLNLTGIVDAANYAVDVWNQGAGGAARLRSSGIGALRVQNAGVVADGLTTLNGDTTINGALLAGATTVAALSATSLAVTNNATVGGTVQGTRLISTVATGTAPLTVASTTLVTNLNADLLDGLDSTAFLTQATADPLYVNVTGDTMTGQLLIQANQGLKLQNSVSGGVISLNATNVADPVLEVKDHSGDTTVTLGNNLSLYQLDVTGDARVSDDLTVVGDLTADRGAFGAASFDGTEELLVNGQSRLKGAVEITAGGLSVVGGSLFQSGLTVQGGFAHQTGTFTTANVNHGFFGSAAIAKPTVSGSRGGNAALNSLCSELANLGLITNSTSA